MEHQKNHVTTATCGASSKQMYSNTAFVHKDMCGTTVEFICVDTTSSLLLLLVTNHFRTRNKMSNNPHQKFLLGNLFRSLPHNSNYNSIN